MFGASEAPVVAIDDIDAARVWGEASGYSAGRQNVFANGLNIHATGLCKLKQRTANGNLCAGVSSETTVCHGIAGNALVADGGKECGNAELGCDVTNDGEETGVREFEQQFVRSKIDAGKHFEIVGAIFRLEP